MADVIAGIERHLRAAPKPETAAEYRRTLQDSFRRLNAEDAALVLKRLLTPDGSVFASDFLRHLSRFARLELLLILRDRLGTQTRDNFRIGLTARAGQGADPTMQKGLRVLFPAGAERERSKFETALTRPNTSGNPQISSIAFRSHYLELSVDNKCETRLTRKTPKYLGLASDSGQNWMEIACTISGHRPGAAYQFRRVVEVGRFYLLENRWGCVYEAAKLDDLHDKDEDLDPENDRIFVIDHPGPPAAPSLHFVRAAAQRDVSQYVYIINATESLEITFEGRFWIDPKSIDWFSVTWLEREKAKGKGQPGDWRRKPGKSAILAGTIKELFDMSQKSVAPNVPTWPY